MEIDSTYQRNSFVLDQSKAVIGDSIGTSSEEGHHGVGHLQPHSHIAHPRHRFYLQLIEQASRGVEVGRETNKVVLNGEDAHRLDGRVGDHVQGADGRQPARSKTSMLTNCILTGVFTARYTTKMRP